jgi:peptidoglycan/xylan/chitin deacetylase (PgdA/CDA1 family)
VIQRIVVFTGALSFTVRKGIVAIADALPQTQWLICEQVQAKPLRILLRNQWRNLKRNGWRWIPYQLGDIVARVAKRGHRSWPRPAAVPGDRYQRSALLARPGVDYVRCTDIHAAEVLERVRNFAPELGLSLAAPILKAPLFGLPRLGTINLHKGKVPFYRGMPPAFWELSRGESAVGCTVHKVEAGLDTGDILQQGEVVVPPHPSVKGMQLRLDDLGVALMRDGVVQLGDGTARWQAQAAGGQTFRKPTLAQEAALRRRLHPRGLAQAVRDAAKDLALGAYVHVLRAGPRRRLAAAAQQRVVVLLYHRVCDELRDSLSIGVAQFDEQMAYLSDNYPLVSIDDVVASRLPRDAQRPLIAVTFDDGYRDNHDFAAPILERHRVPAGFFVSTGMIDNDLPFPHDVRKLGRGLPNMNWQQLRAMHAAGFTIGSHTVTHLDCGQAPLPTVRAELETSRQRLRDELGKERVIFAYPFGGRANMTPAALAVVREMDFDGCLSAYGGVNDGAIDRFNVKRVGVNYSYTRTSFRARLEGYAG